jgi:hypothetical protein
MDDGIQGEPRARFVDSPLAPIVRPVQNLSAHHYDERIVLDLIHVQQEKIRCPLRNAMRTFDSSAGHNAIGPQVIIRRIAVVPSPPDEGFHNVIAGIDQVSANGCRREWCRRSVGWLE